MSRRREIRERVMLGFAALLLAVGAFAYFQSRANEGSAPTTAPRRQDQVRQAPTVKPGGKLDPQAQGVARQFILTALARQNLGRAWDLAAPELRGAVTKKQWLSGELPMPPFPVSDLETTGFDVVGTAPGKILLQVLLVPKLNSGYTPTRYDVTLVRRGKAGAWKVSYFLPYAPPGMYTEPG
jgi:hypothetical protein